MIAQLALQVSECADECDPNIHDEVYDVAMHLESMYQAIGLDDQDCHDFFQGPQPN